MVVVVLLFLVSLSFPSVLSKTISRGSLIPLELVNNHNFDHAPTIFQVTVCGLNRYQYSEDIGQHIKGSKLGNTEWSSKNGQRSLARRAWQ